MESTSIRGLDIIPFVPKPPALDSLGSKWSQKNFTTGNFITFIAEFKDFCESLNRQQLKNHDSDDNVRKNHLHKVIGSHGFYKMLNKNCLE